MPRPRPVREPCDCLDCADAPAPPTTVALAIARQEPPPKSLIIVLHDAIDGDDTAHAAWPPSDCPHVTALVRDGCTGLLAFASSSGASVLDAATNLLGLDARAAKGPTLGERFKGLQAAVLTDTPAVGELFTSAGAGPVEVLCGSSPGPQDGGQLPWPQPAELATRIAQQLGLPFVRLPGATEAAPGLAALEAPMPGSAPAQQAQQAQQPGAASQGAAPAAAAADGDDDDVDMLLLLLDASAAALDEPAAAGAAAAGSGSSEGAAHAQQEQQAGGGAAAEPGSQDAPSPLPWLDSLLQRLNRVEGFRDTVLLTVVLGARRGLASSITGLLEQGERGPVLGAAPEQQQWQQQQQGAGRGGGDSSAEAPSQPQAGPGRPLFRRPLQSYQFRGMGLVGIHREMAALVVHRLPGVIRRDAVEVLDVGQVQRRGGGGCILAERMLPEVAYKLGRAPKYGA